MGVGRSISAPISRTTSRSGIRARHARQKAIRWQVPHRIVQSGLGGRKFDEDRAENSAVCAYAAKFVVLLSGQGEVKEDVEVSHE